MRTDLNEERFPPISILFILLSKPFKSVIRTGCVELTWIQAVFA